MRTKGWILWIAGALIYACYVVAALPWFASMFGFDRIGRIDCQEHYRNCVLVAYNGIEITEAWAPYYYVAVVCVGLLLAAIGLWIMEKGDNILDRLSSTPTRRA